LCGYDATLLTMSHVSLAIVGAREKVRFTSAPTGAFMQNP
jgi:hypothetical protein